MRDGGKGGGWYSPMRDVRDAVARLGAAGRLAPPLTIVRSLLAAVLWIMKRHLCAQPLAFHARSGRHGALLRLLS